MQILPPGRSAERGRLRVLGALSKARSGVPCHRLAGIELPVPLNYQLQLGATTLEVMAEGARKYTHARAIKIKLTGSLELDVARVRAVREARPDVWIGVDANQGFSAS